MANPFQRSYTNFSGGVNQQLPPILPDSEEALRFADTCENWIPGTDGLLKSKGFASVLSSPVGGTPVITGMFAFKSPASGDWEMVVCAGTKIYTLNGSSLTEIKAGQTANYYYQATPWDNGSGTEILILCNGVDTPVYYDGTTCAAITFTDDVSVIWDNAKPKGAAVFRGRIFYWGDSTYPYRIYSPRPGTHNNFDDTTSEVDAFDVDAGFGGAISGLRALTNDFLVIYKERCIRRLEGSEPFASSNDPFRLLEVTNDFGCLAPRTIVQVGLDHYFLSDDGIRQLRPIQSYGDIDPTQPSFAIQDLINGLNFGDDSVIANACAVFDRDERQVIFSVPNGSNTTNNLIIVYDVLNSALYTRPEEDINASYLAVFNRKVYHGDYAGQIYKHGDSNGNNGSVMTATWESKWIAHLGLGTWKQYQDLFLYCDSDGAGDVVVQWKLLRRGREQTKSSTETVSTGDNAWDTAEWDTALWSTGESNMFHIKNLGRGNAIKIRLINASSTQRVKIRQVDMVGRGLGRRLG